MKAIIKLVICLLSLTSFAQVAPLENHTWYLEKLVINNTDFSVPNGFSNSYFANFTNGADYSLNAPCYPIQGTLSYSQNQTFNINDASSPLDCDGLPQQVTEYDEKIMFSINLSNNPFSYVFSYKSNYIELTITNANGDQAIYRNQQLGISNNDKPEVDLYPNPATSSFQLDKDAGSNVKTVRIFSVNGKEVMHFKKPQGSYNISQLSPGIYFVKIEGQIGQKMKKIIIE
ncbi:T9SS type A sorting domain-containing protein [uncultured Mesonia sp.]|uniref:T9SS type A sorting domain-containing protein n=1 Tax=uncultured Mesonia sp. TaxID=399731 RepID=UPI00374F1929